MERPSKSRYVCGCGMGMEDEMMGVDVRGFREMRVGFLFVFGVVHVLIPRKVQVPQKKE